MHFAHTIGAQRHVFSDLKTSLAKASPARPGNYLAGLAVASEGKRMAAWITPADVSLSVFLNEVLVPYEDSKVTRLTPDRYDTQAFGSIVSLTVGEFRDWLFLYGTDSQILAGIAPGIISKMTAAVGKLMRNQDLVIVARKCRMVMRLRNTIGLLDRLSARLQPSHPTDDPRGITASIIDGLLHGHGGMTTGINSVGDNLDAVVSPLQLVDELRNRYAIPTQSCVLIHVANTIRVVDQGAPVDLVFQSVAGSE